MNISHRILMLMACVLPVACKDPPPNAELSETIIWEQANGRADDAEARFSAAHADYSTDGGRAVDNASFSGSHVIKYNYLGGYVHAVPADNPNEQNEETATATSLNKAQTELKINKGGLYKLTADIDLSGIQVVGEGSLKATVSVNIRDTRNRPITDANGNPVPNRDIPGNVQFSNDANGDLQATPQSGTLSGDSFSSSYSTGGQGVQLPVGTYWVQMELNLISSAKASRPAPNPKPQRHIDTAKMTLSVQ